MKRAMIAGGLLALSAVTAQAGWTGCRLGALAGAQAMITDVSGGTTVPGISGQIDGLGASSGQAGLLAGCDMQVGAFVVGVGADYAWGDADWKTSLAAFGNTWSVGARAGYLVTPTTLLYATGGYTRAQMDDITVALNGVNAITFSVPDPQGWFAGLGFEAMVMPNVSIGLSYRFTRFDTQNVSLAPLPAALDLDMDSHVARLELSYRFGWSEPVTSTK